MCGNWNGIFEVDKCVIELILEIDMETKLGQEEENDLTEDVTEKS